jgi:PhnB protein
MLSINAYLTFSGNCREAMNFYHKCFGGTLTFQTIGESPRSDKLPENMKDYILHSTLKNDQLILMGCDMTPDSGLQVGNSVSLSLICSSERETKTLFKKLSQDGIQDRPLKKTFWGALFGDVTDKFGNHWILHCNAGYKRDRNHKLSVRGKRHV